jgi:Ubiquitin carboxyl-terminal hydrolase, family 1
MMVKLTDSCQTLEHDSILKSVLDRCRLVDPQDRTTVINDLEPLIRDKYEKAALQGSTEPPDATAEVECHYVCFTKPSEEALWLLDGTRNGPIKYDIMLGPSEDILTDIALSEIRKFIEENSMEGGLNLGIMALTPT